MGIGAVATGAGLGAFSQGILAPVVGAIGADEEASARARAFQRFRAGQREGVHQSIVQAEGAARQVTNTPTAVAGRNFIMDAFASDSSQAAGLQGAQLRQGLRTAQESRGLRRSTSSAVAEATSLAAFNSNLAFQHQQFQSTLLPYAESFATLGERTRNNRFQTELAAQIGFQTGAPIPGISNQNAILGDPAAHSGLVQSINAGTAGQAAFTSNFMNMFGAVSGGLGGGGGGFGGGAGGGGGGFSGLAKMGQAGGGGQTGGSVSIAQPGQSSMFNVPKSSPFSLGSGGF